MTMTTMQTNNATKMKTMTLNKRVSDQFGRDCTLGEAINTAYHVARQNGADHDTGYIEAATTITRLGDYTADEATMLVDRWLTTRNGVQSRDDADTATIATYEGRTDSGDTDSGVDADNGPKGAYIASTKKGAARAKDAALQRDFDDGAAILSGLDAARILASFDAVTLVAAYMAVLANRDAWVRLGAARGIVIQEATSAAYEAGRLAKSDAGSIVAATARLGSFNRGMSTMLGALGLAPTGGDKPDAKARNFTKQAARAVTAIAGQNGTVRVPTA